jgi:hypothetical protein
MPPYLDDAGLNLVATFAFPNAEERVIALAISMAEDRNADVTATNKNTNGSTDYGLWQINSVHGFPAAELLTSTGNAHAAAAVYAKQGWKAWTTYKNGQYQLYMGRARQASQTPITGTGTAPGKSILDVVGDSVTGTARWVSDPHNWLRVAMVIVGGGLVLGGLVVAAKPVLR